METARPLVEPFEGTASRNERYLFFLRLVVLLVVLRFAGFFLRFFAAGMLPSLREDGIGPLVGCQSTNQPSAAR
jgi:hypothetical protein